MLHEYTTVEGMQEDVRLAWSKLRDCVAVGKQFRYSQEQLVYHYTKEKRVLLQALAAHRGTAGRSTRMTWMLTIGEVLVTLLLPVAIVVLVVLTSKKLPGRVGDDTRLHSMFK